MSRILMISDIHGCVDQLNELLDAVVYAPSKDILILLGDYVDRGPRSKETVERVKELVTMHNAVALRGNHDQRLIDLVHLDEEETRTKFLRHGGIQTLQSYCDFILDPLNDEHLNLAIRHIRDHYYSHIQFLDTLPLYHEDSQHVYVHAGLNPKYSDWRTQPAHDFMYIKADFYHSKPNTDKIVIFGHTRTVELQDSSDVWFGEGKIGIDGACAYGKQLNCLIYDQGHYHSEHVPFRA
jgi:serine/threonine protein phosphatase 1